MGFTDDIPQTFACLILSAIDVRIVDCTTVSMVVFEGSVFIVDDDGDGVRAIVLLPNLSTSSTPISHGVLGRSGGVRCIASPQIGRAHV